jgi:hypothetical protein
MELRESWLSLAEMWEAWAAEAQDNVVPINSRSIVAPRCDVQE